MMKIKSIVLALALLTARGVLAQTPVKHPCDEASTSVSAANTGQVIQFSWCYDSKDTTGAPVATPLTWNIYRNGVLLPAVVVTKSSTSNAAGAYNYSFSRTEPTAGTFTYAVTAVAEAYKESDKLTFASLLVINARTLAAPTHPKIARQ